MKNQSELVRALKKELAAKEKELADQKWVFEQILQSPTWRLTAPVRALVNRFRSLNGRHSPATSADLPSPTENHSEPSIVEFDPVAEFKESFSALHRSALDTFLASGAVLELPASDKPSVSIVLVLFNRAELTLACLRSIAEEHGEPLEVVIVDNASSDNTNLLLERIHGARILRNTENRHFLAAVNQAARECRGEYILLLNNDAQLLPGALRNALATIRSAEDIGAVGGKILLLDGLLQEAGSVVWRDGSCAGYGRGDNPMAPMYNFRRDVDYCSGAFLLTRRSSWERLGGFDESFKPAYYEETDYCMRLWRNGLRVVYEPAVAIAHYEFASSPSTAGAVSLQAAHQALFAERHRADLNTRTMPSPEALLAARSRHTGQRVLFIDDRVPHLWLGSGFPRAHALFRALQSEGCFVTLYPLAVIEEPWDEVYSDFPREVEVMTGWGIGMLESFFRSRRNYYATVIVSRPHNMQHFLPVFRGHPEWFAKVKVVYDAEALFTSRTVTLRQLAGNPMAQEEANAAFAEEVACAEAANLVIAVSEGERQTFLSHGVSRVEVVGHSIDSLAAPRGFEGRDGLLFVGAVYEDDSPNADSLIWFLSEILPLIHATLSGLRLTIAGVNRSERIRQLAGPQVTITGRIPDLGDLYATSKVFIAPTRFAAGIPHKIHEAAANGLPVAATRLLATQLGWTERELAIADDAAAFAAQCIELCTNADRWRLQRDAALARAREECSPSAFKRQVARILAG
jgi:GT2 family glycosyltransferase